MSVLSYSVRLSFNFKRNIKLQYCINFFTFCFTKLIDLATHAFYALVAGNFDAKDRIEYFVNGFKSLLNLNST